MKKSEQGKGYGGLLLEKIMEMFQKYSCAYLEVRETNTIAQKLYKKYGFSILYRRKGYYSDGEDALVMVKFKDQLE